MSEYRNNLYMIRLIIIYYLQYNYRQIWSINSPNLYRNTLYSIIQLFMKASYIQHVLLHIIVIHTNAYNTIIHESWFYNSNLRLLEKKSEPVLRFRIWTFGTGSQWYFWCQLWSQFIEKSKVKTGIHNSYMLTLTIRNLTL
jgi:hypothetical protein